MKKNSSKKTTFDAVDDWRLLEQLDRCKELCQRVYRQQIENLCALRQKQRDVKKSQGFQAESNATRGPWDTARGQKSGAHLTNPPTTKRVTVRPVRYDVKFSCVSNVISTTHHQMEVTSVKNWHRDQCQPGCVTARARTPTKPKGFTLRLPALTSSRAPRIPHTSRNHVPTRTPPKPNSGDHQVTFETMIEERSKSRFRVILSTFEQDFYLVSHGKPFIMQEILVNMLNHGIASVPMGGSGQMVSLLALQANMSYGVQDNDDDCVSIVDTFRVAYALHPNFTELLKELRKTWGWLDGLSRRMVENVYDAYMHFADQRLGGVPFEALSSLLGDIKGLPREELLLLYQKFDTDGDGVLSISEFEKILHGHF